MNAIDRQAAQVIADYLTGEHPGFVYEVTTRPDPAGDEALKTGRGEADQNDESEA